jgi:hypothetical protein
MVNVILALKTTQVLQNKYSVPGTTLIVTDRLKFPVGPFGIGPKVISKKYWTMASASLLLLARNP